MLIGSIVLGACLLLIIPIWIFSNVLDRGKGNGEAALWAVGGFFLQIFIIPVWFSVRPQVGSEGAGMCPKCKEILIRESISCPTCGYMLMDGVVDLSGGMDSDGESGV